MENHPNDEQPNGVEIDLTPELLAAIERVREPGETPAQTVHQGYWLKR